MEITAWRNQEVALVDPYLINSNHFKKIRNIFHRALVYPWLYRIVRMALAALFIYGGVIKLFDPKAFAATISAYDLVPEAFLPYLAVGLPLLETIAGLALLLDRPWGLNLITGLLVLFVFIVSYGIIGDLDVDCGCFGAEDLDKRAALRAALHRDLALIGVVAPYLYLSRRLREWVGRKNERYVVSWGSHNFKKEKGEKMKMRKALITVLMSALLVFGTAGGALAAWGTKELDTEKSAVTFAREVERGGYKILMTEELKGWIDQRKPMLIVDTMPYEASYKKQHVPGSVQMEFPIPEMTQLDDKTKAALEKLLGPDRERLIVFYCGFVKCTRSHNAAMWAFRLGYKNVYRHPGGIKAWDEADYSVDKVK